MPRRSTCALLTSLLLVVGGISSGAGAAAMRSSHPGAPGIGDPYFPKDGNGGYDARHYTLDLTYRPGADRLAGVATMQARATENLSRFNLDLDGLQVLSVQVDGRPARWSRDGGELMITPARELRRGELFTSVISYNGVPQTLPDRSGFIHTPDGALVIGEPKVASTWFPVNDHPSDKASYTFRVTAPRHRPVIANGELRDSQTVDGWTTWHWEAQEPMASYLATASIGRWDVRRYRHGDIEMVDAIDAGLFKPFAKPRTGDHLVMSQSTSFGYQRLMRTIGVPEQGATLSFSVDRRTEPGWDAFAVEAHTVGENDWTTLEDQRGHTSRYPGNACPFWLDFHPFLAHYVSPGSGDSPCVPKGTTGRWHAAFGNSRTFERWTVDLSKYAGKDVQVALAVISDDVIAYPGAFVDDVRVSTGEGTTSFESDGNVLDGWHVAPPPAGSPSVSNNWVVATGSDIPSLGSNVSHSFDRQGEILDFLAGFFGPYPFSASGGIVDRRPGLGFALENQTRPIYAQGFFLDVVQGDAVVVHELAHQWVGDSLSVRRWRHIWLNEGFATYTEWLWSEHEGTETPQEIFDNFYNGIGPKNRFWDLKIGDPGPGRLFDFAVYYRGAMTLQQLRVTVGDDAFFTILKKWATQHRDGNVTTAQFIRLSERVSGKQLDRLFHRWLFTSGRPELKTPQVGRTQDGQSFGTGAAKILRGWMPH